MLAGLYEAAGGMEGAGDRSGGCSADLITEEASVMELYREERYGPDVRDRGKFEIGSLDVSLEHGGTVVSGSEWMALPGMLWTWYFAAESELDQSWIGSG